MLFHTLRYITDIFGKTSCVSQHSTNQNWKFGVDFAVKQQKTPGWGSSSCTPGLQHITCWNWEWILSEPWTCKDQFPI